MHIILSATGYNLSEVQYALLLFIRCHYSAQNQMSLQYCLQSLTS